MRPERVNCRIFFQAEDGIRDIIAGDWSSDVCSSDLAECLVDLCDAGIGMAYGTRHLWVLHHYGSRYLHQGHLDKEEIAVEIIVCLYDIYLFLYLFNDLLYGDLVAECCDGVFVNPLDARWRYVEGFDVYLAACEYCRDLVKDTCDVLCIYLKGIERIAFVLVLYGTVVAGAGWLLFPIQ